MKKTVELIQALSRDCNDIKTCCDLECKQLILAKRNSWMKTPTFADVLNVRSRVCRNTDHFIRLFSLKNPKTFNFLWFFHGKGQ